MPLEDRHVCPHCGKQLWETPYLMSIRRRDPILSWPQALALLAFLTFLCLLVAHG